MGVAGKQRVEVVVFQQDVLAVVDGAGDLAIHVFLDPPTEPVVAIGGEAAAGEVDPHQAVLHVGCVARHPAGAGAGDLAGLAREVAVQIVSIAERLVLDQPVGGVEGRVHRLAVAAQAVADRIVGEGLVGRGDRRVGRLAELVEVVVDVGEHGLRPARRPPADLASGSFGWPPHRRRRRSSPPCRGPARG